MNNYIILIAQNDNITTDMFDTDNTIQFDSTNIDESSFDTNNTPPPEQNFNQNNYQENYQGNYQATSEIPALPAVTPEKPSEMQTIMHKSSISFGVLAIIIILILLAAFIYKKSRSAQKYNYEEPEAEQEEFKENLDTEVHIQEHTVPQKVQRKNKKKDNLNTPATIHHCITEFLERTKEV